MQNPVYIHCTQCKPCLNWLTTPTWMVQKHQLLEVFDSQSAHTTAHMLDANRACWAVAHETKHRCLPKELLSVIEALVVDDLESTR